MKDELQERIAFVNPHNGQMVTAGAGLAADTATAVRGMPRVAISSIWMKKH